MLIKIKENMEEDLVESRSKNIEEYGHQFKQISQKVSTMIKEKKREEGLKGQAQRNIHDNVGILLYSVLNGGLYE